MTDQMAVWSGEFGAEYTARNPRTIEAYEQGYRDTVGVTRTQLNAEFLADVPKDARILEVGTNVGMQLALLDRAGWRNLYGVELQWGAIDVARGIVPRANIVQGDAFEIPFRGGWFDLVFTSGVLIHIDPFTRYKDGTDLEMAMREINRCSRRWIFGDEYYAGQMTEVPYHGRSKLLWKGDYAGAYRGLFPALKLVRDRLLPHVRSPNTDMMFLLEKP